MKKRKREEENICKNHGSTSGCSKHKSAICLEVKNNNPSWVQSALGMHLKCYLLPIYLAQCFDVPAEAFIECDKESQEHPKKESILDEMWSIVIAPFHNNLRTNDSLPSQEKPKQLAFVPVVSEPLESIVDGVIASLVIRCRRYNHIAKFPSNNTRNDDINYNYFLQNVLSSGYNIAGNHWHSTSGAGVKSYCVNMPPGITCNTPNTTALWAKTNPIILRLHNIVGDDILRNILLNTIMLIPTTLSSSEHNNNNYLQLCGPPLSTLLKQQPEGKQQRKRLTSCINNVASKRSKQLRCVQSGGQPNVCSTASRQQQFCQNNETILNPNEPLPRSRLYFCEGFFKKVGLPKSHLLNQTPSSLNYTDLLNSIMKFKVGSKFNRRRWKRLRNRGIDMMKRLHLRHLKKCDYHRILNRHCPLPSFDLKEREPNHGQQMVGLEDLIAAHSPATNVYSYLKEVLRITFPRDFWGSEYNFGVMLKTLEKYVQLRRYEEIPLKLITKGLRIMDFQWLSDSSPTSSTDDPFRGGAVPNATKRQERSTKSLSDHAAATKLVLLALRWVYVAYIHPLLRSAFYITDSEFAGHSTLYYRRPVWSALRRRGIQSLLSGGQFTEYIPHSAERLDAYFASNRTIGLPKLRLLPKKNGIRPIATLSKSEKFTVDGKVMVKGTFSSDKRFPPPNVTLRPTFEVLKFERAKDPTMFGCGVYGIDQIASLLCQFKAKLSGFKTDPQGRGETPVLYFASVDMHRCYDKINQKHLFELIPDVLQHDDYLVQAHFVLQKDGDTGALKRKFMKNVSTPELFLDIQRIAEQSNQTESIFVDNSCCNVIKKKSVIELLKEHIFEHAVLVHGSSGSRIFCQRNGIPQGSVLSTMLCNIYYGKVEQILFQDLFDDNCTNLGQDAHFLARIVDDFFFITTKKDTAERFLQIMYRGLPALGVEINEKKTLVNFDVCIKTCGGTMQNIQKSESKDQFPWCGMLFHTETCDVKVDYSRFLGNTIINSLIVSYSGMEGKALEGKMKSFIQPRVKIIFYDHSVNSKRTACFNFFEAHLFCAIKTTHYVSAMQGAVQSNFKHVIRCIENTISYSYYAICRLCWSDTTVNVFKAKNAWFLNPIEALWLARHAFVQVFSRTRTRTLKLLAYQLTKMNDSIFGPQIDNLRRLSDEAFSNGVLLHLVP
jgi:hypothetical protein